MWQQVVSLLKSALYSVAYKNTLQGYGMHLGAIFHTERIYDEQVYDQLMVFCQSYLQATGARAICCIIPPTNLRVQDAMATQNVTEDIFLQRVYHLAQVATIGYHGHFWLYNHLPSGHVADIRSTQSAHIFVSQQLQRDLAWFHTRGIAHNGLYAGGWWYQDPSVIALLAQAGFVCDFSCSQIPYFFNRTTHNAMLNSAVPFGKPILLQTATHSLLSIQNLVSIHPGTFVQDFDRHVKKYLPSHPTALWGVLNAHDYDLVVAQAMQVVHHLQSKYQAHFLSAQDLIAQTKKQALPVVL